jgi:hypothetical protein
MKLVELVEMYQTGKITLIGAATKLKLVADELNQAYPAEGSLLSKFRVCIHGDDHLAWCDISNKFKRLISFEAGFRPFCGNQSICECNRNNSNKMLSERPKAEWDHIISKRKNTNIAKYGSESASNSHIVKEKAALTNMARYGAKAATQNPQVLEKMKETNQQVWGVDYVQQHPEIRAKTKLVFENTYGGSCPAQNSQVKQKTKNTNLEKYGAVAPFLTQAHISLNRLRLRNQSYQSQVLTRSDLKPLFTKDDYVNGSHDQLYHFTCVGCNSRLESLVTARDELRCYACFPKRETWGESAIKTWLQQHHIPFEQWDRQVIKPLELDFWLPQHHIGIEFNGTWYHRHERLQDKKYHQHKWQQCQQKGARLIQIWEHELHSRSNVIFDRLAHVLGLHSKSVGARKCKLIKVDQSSARSFLNDHHLQGYVPTPHMWGLALDGELQCLASFVKNRFNKKADYELARYCVKAASNVQGGLSRLLHHAQKELGFGSLLSYSNLNWGAGDGYEKVGFELDHISVPNYWYFKGVNDVRSRHQFQKHKIKHLAPGNTEAEIATNMGYSRFYDAGNAVWIKRY